jgi:hypothetical protein
MCECLKNVFSCLKKLLDVIFQLTILGVSADRPYLLVPWLSLSFFTLICCIVLVLSLMFSFANDMSAFVFLCSGKSLAVKLLSV